jgi:hypothetical protein
MCVWIWCETPAWLPSPRLCLVERSIACCCKAPSASTDTLRVSKECIACLAVSCMIVKSWTPRSDSERPCKPKVNSTDVQRQVVPTFSMFRTTSRIDQTEESCSSSILCKRGTCKENGSEGGSLGHIRDRVCLRSCWNVGCTPMQSTMHL